jgi:UDP-4-amino-4-deoxy-L-arabinose formyltransferase/UDP-glucuronic acid dehydrogenase (UDP-4-keto-hexauronic acid decarboxylating)
LTVFLAAEEGAGARALRATAAMGHRIAGVLSAGGSGGPAADAERAGVPVLHPGNADELPSLLHEQGVDLLLNVHSLRILPPEVLAAPAIGCFNLHPGPLPRFAGLNAPSWAIYEGETRYGCSLHWMTPEIDAGPLAYDAAFDVEPRETGLSLSVKCTRHGLPLVEALLADASAGGEIPARRQDLAQRRYLPPGPPHDGRVPWDEPAVTVDGFVRACTYDPFPSPWGDAATSITGRRVAIGRLTPTGRAATEPPGTVGAAHGGAVEVAAADEWVLVESVRVEGAPAVPAEVLPRGERLA